MQVQIPLLTPFVGDFLQVKHFLFCTLEHDNTVSKERLKVSNYLLIVLLYTCLYTNPLGGGHIIFAFSAVRRPTWFPDILGNSSYPIFTRFGMQVYWVNSLYGIAFGDDSSIAN